MHSGNYYRYPNVNFNLLCSEVHPLLSDPEVRSEYERFNREEFALLDQMLAARREAGLSQARVAERMGTNAPAITRLERALASGQHSPSIGTLRRYAAACGKSLFISIA